MVVITLVLDAKKLAESIDDMLADQLRQCWTTSDFLAVAQCLGSGANVVSTPRPLLITGGTCRSFEQPSHALFVHTIAEQPPCERIGYMMAAPGLNRPMSSQQRTCCKERDLVAECHAVDASSPSCG